ncbi:MAG: hypothetical protein JRF63_08630, partial [Deltaproteobacteria bacterium]|nr:hypothetical protein [Deltaproteobacteria bacterium]
MLVPAFVGSGPSVGRIVEPTAAAPVEILAGEPLRAIARLRLPLTPPPGVQQPRVWEGWEVRLSRRVEVVLDGASPLLEFPARLLRIRPDEGDRYSITVDTPPWLPPGRYDLAIAGPGFEGLAVDSVVVKGAGVQANAERAEWRLLGEATAELVRAGDGADVVAFEVVLPAAGAGLLATGVDRATGSRQELELVGATWTTAPGPGGKGRARLLRFLLDLPRQQRGEVRGVRVELERVAGSSCRPEIRWSAVAKHVGPTEWRELIFDGLDQPVSIIWDFGDGEHVQGRRARHRWIFSSKVPVSATGFDRVGVACSATTSADSELVPARGCDCSAVGRGVDPTSLLDFFLSAALP